MKKIWTEFRKVLSIFLLDMAFYIMPDCQFKVDLSMCIVEFIHRIDEEL